MYAPVSMDKLKYLPPYVVEKPMFFYPLLNTLGCLQPYLVVKLGYASVSMEKLKYLLLYLVKKPMFFF